MFGHRALCSSSPYALTRSSKQNRRTALVFALVCLCRRDETRTPVETLALFPHSYSFRKTCTDISMTMVPEKQFYTTAIKQTRCCLSVVQQLRRLHWLSVELRVWVQQALRGSTRSDIGTRAVTLARRHTHTSVERRNRLLRVSFVFTNMLCRALDGIGFFHAVVMILSGILYAVTLRWCKYLVRVTTAFHVELKTKRVARERLLRVSLTGF